uniref:G_PROTEIN_RECEP_F1_2 domain-containing protein n=1 Tax=Angiostrongylus cantonensis TaxID=6313 RepID=A0A158PAH6_ANGCA
MNAARKRFRRERDRRTTCRPPVDQGTNNTASLIVKSKNVAIYQDNSSVVDSSTSTQSEEDRAITYRSSQQETKFDNLLKQGSDKSMVPVCRRKKRRSKETTETKRERKAWRTLAIITGTFVACWTPFFLVSLYRPICRCTIPKPVETVTAWLGYLNSALNPIIYTVFSQDFRVAFKKIIKRICLLKE